MTTMTMRNRLSHGTALAMLIASSALAATPRTLTYSGTLLDSQGQPVTTTTTIAFRLYSQPADGAVVWEDSLQVSPDTTGWFTAILGASVPNPIDPVDFQQPMWLGIQVASDPAEMAPRVALTPAPYALSVDYTNVLGLPRSFPSSWTDVSDKPASFPTTWNDVTGKPSIFPSNWADVSGKPSTFPSNWVDVSGRPTTFPVDPSAVQSRVSGSCQANQYIRIINQDGTVTCGSDASSGGTVTSVSATGIGNPISVTNGTTTPALAFKACGAGQVLKYEPPSGWMCANVSPIVVNNAGCGLSCSATTADDYSTITVNSITITTPGPGTVVVQFTGTVECNIAASQVIDVYGQLLATSTGLALGYAEGGVMFRVIGPTGKFDGAMNAHRAFAVAAAGAHTYYYRANNWNGGGGTATSCSFYGGNMTATYYP